MCLGAGIVESAPFTLFQIASLNVRSLIWSSLSSCCRWEVDAIGAPAPLVLLPASFGRSAVKGSRFAVDPNDATEVYAIVLRKARLALAAGQSVVVDAVYAAPEERSAVEDLAAELGVPFQGLWLTAPADTLAARVDARRGDASDATSQVVRQQLTWQLGVLSPAWTMLDAGGSAQEFSPPRCVRPGCGRPSCAVANLRLHISSESRSIKNRTLRIFFHRQSVRQFQQIFG